MPADPGSGCVITFQNWSGIDVTFLSSAESTKEIVDLVQVYRHHVVVIIAPRVPRDSTGCSLRSRGSVGHISLKVIQRYDDNRSRAWQNLLWITPFFLAALHVTHFSRRTLAQPILKLSDMGRGSASGNTARIKSQIARKRDQLFF